jgi:hypothetical protein
LQRRYEVLFRLYVPDAYGRNRQFPQSDLDIALATSNEALALSAEPAQPAGESSGEATGQQLYEALDADFDEDPVRFSWRKRDKQTKDLWRSNALVVNLWSKRSARIAAAKQPGAESAACNSKNMEAE